MRLLFMIDNTSSMEDAFKVVRCALDQILQVIQITQPQLEIALLLYGDYDTEKVISFVPWTNDIKYLNDYLYNFNLTGGMDNAEAVKTALYELLKHVNKNDIIIHFTDAPPHHPSNEDPHSRWNMYPKELAFLKKHNLSHDWVDICRQIHDREITIFTILFKIRVCTQKFMTLLGPCIRDHANDSSITRVTMKVMYIILQSMGIQYTGPDEIETYFDHHITESKVQNEIDLVCQYFNDTNMKSRKLQIEVNTSAITNVSECITRFKTDEEYKKNVINVFNNLFKPDTILALTYNDLFGKLWREICKDNESQNTLSLANKLSYCCDNIESMYKDHLRQWVDSSYNYIEEINATIDKIEKPYPCLILNIQEKDYMSRRVMQDVARTSCTTEDLNIAQRLLFQMEIAHEPIDGKRPMGHYVPLNVPNHTLFKFLGHLMCPGTMLSLRPACVIAMLAYHSNNQLLMNRAKQFLNENRGKWIHMDDPEQYPQSYTFQFTRLGSKLPDEFLTPLEREQIDNLQKTARIKLNKNKQFNAIVSYTPQRNEYTFDTFTQCGKCLHYQPISMITVYHDKPVCTSCLWKEAKDPLEVEKNPNVEKSIMERCKSCKCIYSIIAPIQKIKYYRSEPKCHYCRMKSELSAPQGFTNKEFSFGGPHTPYIKCVACSNKFVCPTASLQPRQDFICAVCEKTPHLGKREVVFTLKTLIEENPKLLNLFGIDASSATYIFQNLSLYKLRDKITFSECNMENIPITINSIDVLNKEELILNILNQVDSGSILQTCDLCFEGVEISKFASACGKCNYQLCKTCLKNWYGDPKPGNIVLPPRLQCPFCKQKPLWSVIKLYNKHLANIMSGGDNPFDTQWYVAWCTQCYKLKRHSERACSQETPYTTNFICEDCSTNNTPLNIKKCPSCDIITEKTSGCSHITCLVPTCGAHWCWECNGEFTNATIYRHMIQQHGGYGFT